MFPDMRLGHDTAEAIAAATGSMILLDDMKGKTEKEEIVMCKALEALVQKGEEQGMDSINRLNSYLLKNNMHAELERSIADSGYQKELMKKYQDQLVVADGPAVYQ